MTALDDAQTLGVEAARDQFCWQKPLRVLPKLAEEVDELKVALEKADWQNVHEEIGDVLFAVAQVARLCDVRAETLLHEANEKFKRRYAQMKALAAADALDFSTLTLDEQQDYWLKVKSMEGEL